MSAEFGKNEGFVLSTDCIGRYGKLNELYKVWGGAINTEGFLGAEVIAWKNTINSLGGVGKLPIKIAGFHGPMGTFGKEAFDLRARALNIELAAPKDIMEKAPPGSYLLLHSVYLNSSKNKEALLENIKPEQKIMVENHIHKGALNHALAMAFSLREKGVNAGIMIDIVHYFAENSIKPEQMAGRWKGMLAAVKKTIKEARAKAPDMPIGIHLPVGNNKTDSLLMDHIKPSQWKRLAEVIHSEAYIPTILENQQEEVGSFFLTPESMLTQKYRNEKNFELLTENGVIGDYR